MVIAAAHLGEWGAKGGGHREGRAPNKMYTDAQSHQAKMRELKGVM